MSLGDDLARKYPRLGSGEGEVSNQYLHRFKLADGTPCVCEKKYPNVWLRFDDYSRKRTRFVAVIEEKRVPQSEKHGFHSNVLSTKGFEDQAMIVLKAPNGGARIEIQNYLASFK